MYKPEADQPGATTPTEWTPGERSRNLARSALPWALRSLGLLGQPIPDWMDGKALADGLNAEFLERSPPKTVHDQGLTSEAESAGYTAEDEAEIAKRLADLGYIE